LGDAVVKLKSKKGVNVEEGNITAYKTGGFKIIMYKLLSTILVVLITNVMLSSKHF
jgi:hypothetical protein